MSLDGTPEGYQQQERHTCIKDDGGTPNRRCYACEAEEALAKAEERIEAALAKHPAGTIGEVRVTDPTTGGQKGTKLARFGLLIPEFMWELAEVYGKGAEKYSDRNWEKGYAWHLSYDALQRHIHQWVMGESTDPETGRHHLAHAAWHCGTLFLFERLGLGTDDIRRSKEAS